jgi:hypothetical protein
MSASVRREVLIDGTVLLESARCAFYITRLRAAVVLVRIVGSRLDTGELGTLPMDEIAVDLGRAAPVELFIDASEAAGAIVSVQEDWAGWFARQRASLRRVNMLVQGPYMHFTVEVTKFFSRTGELIRVYLDRGEFDRALASAVQASPTPSR